ncbi:putative cysteine protease [Hibiscus syriacus]|uniref:Cysteine protease n=1 Tax=Hibiscus syriacus TaxID=106335 RepID=A0A6A2YFF2_HIBSY|nr:zingipain-1-like [Hibiscus syriacus]KAE8678106.1 putative cysteine protease [Hibiscus syriacus]
MSDSNTFLFLIVGILASQAMSRTVHESAIDEHEQWMVKHGRTYKDRAEKDKRFKIFKENFEYVHSFNNAGNTSYKLSINKHSDLTHDEFVAARTGDINPSNNVTSTEMSFRYAEFAQIPSSLDWRTEGAVTAVKNQHNCGCCWAFAAVAATEGATQIKTQNLVSLSEQQVLDCSDNNDGCNGGNKISAFQYIVQNSGLTSEDNYPYQQTQGACDMQKQASQVAVISSYEKVPPNSEQDLVKAVSNQPVVVSIEASGPHFRHYKSGVFTGNCGTQTNHAVTVVGFGTSDDGIDYWLVKNSWGVEDWGEDGYIRMQRNVADPQGLCGLAIRPAYPTA